MADHLVNLSRRGTNSWNDTGAKGAEYRRRQRAWAAEQVGRGRYERIEIRDADGVTLEVVGDELRQMQGGTQDPIGLSTGGRQWTQNEIEDWLADGEVDARSVQWGGREVEVYLYIAAQDLADVVAGLLWRPAGAPIVTMFFTDHDRGRRVTVCHMSLDNPIGEQMPALIIGLRDSLTVHDDFERFHRAFAQSGESARALALTLDLAMTFGAIAPDPGRPRSDGRFSTEKASVQMTYPGPIYLVPIAEELSQRDAVSKWGELLRMASEGA